MDFDIIEYISGLTSYIFDKAIYKRIALERGVSLVMSFEELDTQKKDLLLADVLYVAYTSPKQSASVSLAHGSNKKTVGGQTTGNTTDLFNIIKSIYTKYGDSKLELLTKGNGTLNWINIDDRKYV